MALHSALLADSGSLFGGFPKDREPMDRGDDVPPHSASSARLRAASEIPLQDRVTILPNREGNVAGDDIALSTYGLSARLQARHWGRMLDSASAGRADPVTPDSPGPVAGAVDFDGTLKDVSGLFSDSFGADSTETKQFGSLMERLQSLDPKMAQGILVMIKMIARESPEAAAWMSRSFEGLAAMFENGLIAPPEDCQRQLGHFRVAMEQVETVKTAQVAQVTLNVEVGVHTIITESFSLRIESGRVEISLRTEEMEQGDPLVFDLAGDGIDLRGVEDGVDFDLDGSGVRRQTAFIQGDDALLYLDRNGNGIVDNGLELFGDQEGHAHGFAELATHDGNADSVIDEMDAIYDRLHLWQDRNGDGVNQETESLRLREAGVQSVNLRFTEPYREDGKGNTLAQQSVFTRTDGSEGLLVDALLRYRV